MFRAIIFLTFFAAAVPCFCEEQTALDRARREAYDSAESRKCVDAGLRWIADHQLADGGWSFDLDKCPKCRGQCSDSGHLADARIAPTALALWAMFRGEQTPRRGEHRRSVAKGLKFLLDRAQKEEGGWSFGEESGPLDSHALTMIMLCEAYGIDGRRLSEFKETVQRTASHGLSVQNRDGGWGRPKSDIVSTAWYMFALDRYHRSYLDVPAENVKRLTKYIDRIAAEDEPGPVQGSPRNDHRRATAAELFCRIHIDKPFEDPVKKAIDRLAAGGYAKEDMVYNLFAGETLILHGTTGLHQDARWRRWNVGLRDWLVEQQVKDGHESGSWTPVKSSAESSAGGRLYSTAMATLILETYYVPRWCNCGRGGHQGDEEFPE